MAVGGYTYTVRTVDASGTGVQCAMPASNAINITVHPFPSGLSLTPSAVAICAGNYTTLTAAPTGAASYSIGEGWQSSNTFSVSPVSTSTYSLHVMNSGGCSLSITNAATVTVNTPPAAPDGLSSNITRICSGIATTMTLTATGGSMGSGAVYEWGTGAVGNGTPATTAANTYSVAPSVATTYWVRRRGTGACSAITTGGTTTAITVYSAISGGAITPGTSTINKGASPNVTITNVTAATGGSGSITYQWRRTGTSSATLTGTAATYNIGTDAANYSAAGTYYFNRYAKDATCNTAFVAATGAYTLGVLSQPQGSCTYTEPAVVGTFANFPATYSASTYVSLTDGRDNKVYPVVKIGGRWIMARNLNYQTGLSWQANANSPSTLSGNNPDLIGYFWCPGGTGSASIDATTSTRASCDVWGAFYSWETAMMVDGKWTSSAHSSSSWSQPVNASYGTLTTSGNYQNHARSDAGAVTGGRGICPPNWHVPTDGEWGDLFNAMESGTVTNHNTTSGTNRGEDAGMRAKSKCMYPTASSATDVDVRWQYSSSAQGTDVYNFRVLPAGFRQHAGDDFHGRGNSTTFWSSTANNYQFAWYRTIGFNTKTVNRISNYRSYGNSVRCIRD
jgi:uncharacterized protein (TIGR02145 family)